MSDIFLSYAREDGDFARTLAASLEAQGWTVWWDKKISPGRTFDTLIESELSKARCVVVLWSSSSIVSDWVRNEATDGKDRQALVPVMIEDVKQPLAFRHIEFCELAGWSGDRQHLEFQKLVNAIAALLSGQPPASSRTTTGPLAVTARSSTPSGEAERPRTLLPAGKRVPVLVGSVVAGIVIGGAFLVTSRKPSDPATGSIDAGVAVATAAPEAPSNIVTRLSDPTKPPPVSSPEPAPPAPNLPTKPAPKEPDAGAAPGRNDPPTLQIPHVVESAPATIGKVLPDGTRKVIHDNLAGFLGCYKRGLARNPSLEGKITTRFTIDASGAVSGSSNAGSDLQDGAVVSCIIGSYRTLKFPKPEAGTTVVLSPLKFTLN